MFEKVNIVIIFKVKFIIFHLPFFVQLTISKKFFDHIKLFPSSFRLNLSDFKSGAFGKAYGLELTDSALAGLHSRAVVVLDENGTVIHAEQVAEIANEPNYEAALNALQ